MGSDEALMQEVRHDNIKVLHHAGIGQHRFGGDQRAMKAGSYVRKTSKAVMDLLAYPDRALASRIELRPSRPPERRCALLFNGQSSAGHG